MRDLIDLDGPFAAAAWVRLHNRISNTDDILRTSGQLDMNFCPRRFRVWGAGHHDTMVASREVSPHLWTHDAMTRGQTGPVQDPPER